MATRGIYLDNAATTQVAPEVAAAIVACLREDFGNPSSAHRFGIAASARLKTAREQLLSALGDDPRNPLGELIWTSGGTEADALGVAGAARARGGRGRHVVVSALEHPAVLGAAKQLEAEGFQTTTVACTDDGIVPAAAIAQALTPATILVACMLVNNELGTIQPIAEIARAVRAERGANVHLHCDAVQGLGKLAIDVHTLGIDSLAVSAHKLAGPKGVGALWLRKGARIQPLWSGGGQQHGLRSGTENVPGIVGLGLAAELATARLGEDLHKIRALGETLIRALQAGDSGASVNGGAAPRVPHIVSIAFPGAPAEPLLHALEARGILVSAGAACASQGKGHGASHVLKAIGLGDDVGTLRLSFSRDTSESDLAQATAILIEEARRLHK